MKRMTIPLTLLITLLWASLQPAEVLNFTAGFIPVRKALISLTGAVALAWMAVCMILALRPTWLEGFLGGLDRMYGIHKWTGIGAVLLIVTHWLLILSPRTLAAWGWIEQRAKGHRGHGSGFSLIGPAKEMGEWAAWVMIALGIVALLRFIPYGWFRKAHKAFPVAFLIGAFHSIVMVFQHDGQGGTIYGIVLIAMSVIGSLAALCSLTGKIGSSRRHAGMISRVSNCESGIIELNVAPSSSWPGHRAGQFVLLTLNRREGPHPFTIASGGIAGSTLRFAIKPLGDYTRALPGQVRVGDPVTIEGPYGCFSFGDGSEPQVWIAGGIGVTPFLARLEQLASEGGARVEVHFFYCLRKSSDAVFPSGLEALCRKAGVQLHLHVDENLGQISEDRIGIYVQKAKNVWFCGPAAWGRALESVLLSRYGLPAGRFHREVFDFR